MEDSKVLVHSVPKLGYGTDIQAGKKRQFDFTKLQIDVSFKGTALVFVCNLIAHMFGTYKQFYAGAQFAAEFAALLCIGLIGGLIAKVDANIHMIGAEHLLLGDWHEYMRSLKRKTYLNWVSDVFGLLPITFLFLWSNVLVWYHWRFLVPKALVILGNFILAVLAILWVPHNCTAAHEEVKEQFKLYEENLANSKPTASTGPKEISLARHVEKPTALS